MSDGNSWRELQTKGVCEIDSVLGRLGGCRKSQIRFLGGHKVRRTCFTKGECSTTDPGSRDDISCQKGIGCQEIILKSIDFKSFCPKISVCDGIVIWKESSSTLYLLQMP